MIAHLTLFLNLILLTQASFCVNTPRNAETEGSEPSTAFVTPVQSLSALAHGETLTLFYTARQSMPSSASEEGDEESTHEEPPRNGDIRDLYVDKDVDTDDEEDDQLSIGSSHPTLFESTPEYLTRLLHADRPTTRDDLNCAFSLVRTMLDANADDTRPENKKMSYRSMVCLIRLLERYGHEDLRFVHIFLDLLRTKAGYDATHASATLDEMRLHLLTLITSHQEEGTEESVSLGQQTILLCSTPGRELMHYLHLLKRRHQDLSPFNTALYTGRVLDALFLIKHDDIRISTLHQLWPYMNRVPGILLKYVLLWAQTVELDENPFDVKTRQEIRTILQCVLLKQSQANRGLINRFLAGPSSTGESVRENEMGNAASASDSANSSNASQ